MTIAYSYVRFSTSDQLRGDSLRRQTELAERYAAQHRLKLSDKSFRDLGVSGFSGAHIRDGSGLQMFLKAIDEGAIEAGSYLLIENLDRLSRLEPDESIDLLKTIVRRGITVVTLMDGKVYTQELLRSDFGTFIQSALQFFLSHQESLKKQKRLNEVWNAKRQNKSTKFRLPMWLRRGEDGSVTTKEPEASWIREIFKLASSGMGSRLIGKTMKAITGRSWPKSTISRILKDRSVIGEHQYRVGRGSKRLPVGDAVQDIFPAIVSVADFTSAQRTSAPSGPAKTDDVRNLFTGIVKCSNCLSSLHLKRPSARDKYERLVCSGQCGARSIRYAEFEENVLPLVDDVITDLAQGQGQEERKRLADIKGQLSELHRQRDRLADAIATSDDLVATLVPRLSAVNQDIQAVEKEREDLEAELRSLSTDSLTEVHRLIQQAPSLPAETRRRLRSLIGSKVPLILAGDDGVGIITSADAKEITQQQLLTDLSEAAQRNSAPAGLEDGNRAMKPPKATYH